MNWRDISGFEGRYQVSDTGSVRSLDRVIIHRSSWGTPTERRYPGKLLTPQPFPNGYLGVHLGTGKVHLVHRLVATAFVTGDATQQVNHKNGERADNRAENLEWLTCSDNHRHSYRELSRKKHGKTTAVCVGARVFESMLAAAQALGVSAGSISSALHKGHRCRGMEVSHV